MFDRTITLYNYRKSERIWYGTVINGCTLVATESSSDSARGVGSTSSVNIHVHTKPDRTVLSASGGVKVVVPSKEYQSLATVVDEITFTPEVDFIVVDRAMENLVETDEDYENGFYHYVNNTIDNVFMVTNATWYNLIPHFVVGGR